MELVERDLAMQLLDGLLDDAAGGSGRLALVSGEAGVGKTALVSGFLGSCAGRVRVLAGACDPVVTPRPLGPLADIARSVGGELAALLDRETGSGPVLDALLRSAAGSLPAVVLLEDLHWADEATLEVLCLLGRRLAGRKMLVIATYRDDDLSGEHPLRAALGNLPSAPVVQRLPLPPLSEAGVRALVAGRQMDVARLLLVTGGNPFFLTELLAAEGEQLPATVRDAVLARVRRLSADCRVALEIVAAVGRPAEISLLERLGVGAAALDEGIMRGMLRWQDLKAEFRHELARSAVLGELPPGRAALVHSRILAALRSGEAGSDPAELAWHAEEAADAAAVLEYAPAAALQAERLNAHREAAAQYSRALRFAGSEPAARRADLAESCSREVARGGRFGDAIAMAQLALELRQPLGDDLTTGATLAFLASLSWHTGGRAAALSLAMEAITLLERLPPGGELASAYATLASLHAQAAEMADAAAVAGRALRLADELGLAEVRISALGTLGAAKLCGPREDGWPELEQALEQASDSGLADQAAAAYGRILWFGAMHRQFGQFERYFDEAVAFSASRHLEAARRGALRSRCVELAHRGRWSEAEELAQELLAEPGLTAVDQVEPLYVLGRLRARRGDPDVWGPLDAALDLCAPRSELQHIGNVRAARAEAAWLAGRKERMVAEARAAYPLALPVEDPWILGELALWLWRGDALEAVEPVLADHPYGLQIAGDWASAAAGWERLGCPFEQAGALLDSGEVTALWRALQIFDGLGARPAVALAARRLRVLGERGVPRGIQHATRANPHQLTRRQQEILALLGEGLSDAEIATRLFLSAKTVGNHVSAVLAKLGARSRMELIGRQK
jgi:DNA-binding CsgD family transcriptional regulator